jgi:hypothetical protein
VEGLNPARGTPTLKSFVSDQRHRGIRRCPCFDKRRGDPELIHTSVSSFGPEHNRVTYEIDASAKGCGFKGLKSRIKESRLTQEPAVTASSGLEHRDGGHARRHLGEPSDCLISRRSRQSAKTARANSSR